MQIKKGAKPEKFFIQFRVNKWIYRLLDPGDFLLEKLWFYRFQQVDI